MRVMYFETIAANKVCYYINKQDCIIVDLRDSSDFLKGHIPSAVNIPYGEIVKYTNYLCGYKEIVLYCSRGNLSLLAAKSLDINNCRIYSVCGGLHAYRGEMVKGNNNI